MHETISFNGEAEELDCDLIHHAYPTLSSYIEHMDRYSSLGADILVEKNRSSRSLIGFLLNILVVPQVKFVWDYFVRFGFLDGREGLLLNLYHATYTSWKYAKAWERSRATPAEEKAEPEISAKPTETA